MIFDRHLLNDESTARDAVEAIQVTARNALGIGLITPEYVSAVCEREASFPTGLPTTASVGVAVPHATPTEAGQAFSLSVARFSQPVSFREMGMAGETVDVRVVFLLSFPHNDSVGLIAALAGLFQDQEAMKSITTSTLDECYAVIRRGLESANITIESTEDLAR